MVQAWAVRVGAARGWLVAVGSLPVLCRAGAPHPPLCARTPAPALRPNPARLARCACYATPRACLQQGAKKQKRSEAAGGGAAAAPADPEEAERRAKRAARFAGAGEA